MKTLNVYFLPKLADADQIANSTCVVIDVLRATTTIAFALDRGADEVIPCLEIEDARAAAAKLAKGTYVLGGERGGKKIEGFDLGNSPAEYTPETVAGKSVLFTTTNGTRALVACTAADKVLCGAFANLSSVCRAIQATEKLNVICAGTDGHITREDVIVAGAIVERLGGAKVYLLNDEALLAQAAWQQMHPHNEQTLCAELAQCRGGRNLKELGMESDVLLSARIDTTQVTPCFSQGRIRRLKD